MTTFDQLRADVDERFAAAGWSARGWPDPHPDLASPAEEEYSRCLEPEKYRIMRGRADAWVSALVDGDLATVMTGASVDLSDARWMYRRTLVDEVVRVEPRAAGAEPIHLIWTTFGTTPALGLAVGVGDPAVVTDAVPVCGCDACDGGSERLLHDLDDVLGAVVTGRFVWRSRGERAEVTLIDSEVSRDYEGPRELRVVAGAAWL